MNRNTCLIFSLLLLLSTPYLSAQGEEPLRVLFVGNSYTYFWNLPQTIAAMATEEEFPLEARQSTSGGTHWGHHWRGERELKTREKIEHGSFDAIVFQNHSMSSLNRVDSMFHFGSLFAEAGKAKDASIYLYMTWAREWDPYMQAEISKQYQALAKKTGAQVVPVGLAWERARALRPGFALYDEDQSHPSPLGTYLTACVFYGAFSGKSPVGLPNRVIAEDSHGEKLYLNIQSQQNALFCQKVAEEVLNQWNKD
ncbi:MAG: hypothetical protein AAF696_14655 [Bacteroidota bacterium]